ncbi:MAG: hypothetical protein FJ150_05100 [Euryarchaeota archaeon]|nr:hypothetical protein [Euryarchaeota archaeon]
MKYIRGKVKHIKREYQKRLKSGKTKIYTSEQFIINLPKDTNFQDNENVAVIPLKTFNYMEKTIEDVEKKYNDMYQDNENLRRKIDKQKNIIYNLKTKIRDLESMKLVERLEKYEKLLTDYKELQNKHEHLQGQLNKSENEILHLQRIIKQLESVSLLDRLLNRAPPDIKKLEEIKKK